MINNRDTAYREDLGRLTPRLREIARALVQDHTTAQADDLVQATLVRALATDERRHGDRLTIWGLSLLIGLHRAQVHAATAGHRITAGGRSVPAGMRPVAVHEGGRQNTTRDAIGLSAVPLEPREALVLVTLGRLTYLQAAEVLGVSITTVVARLARARDHLAQVQQQADVRQYTMLAPDGVRRDRRPAHLHLVK